MIRGLRRERASRHCWIVTFCLAGTAWSQGEPPPLKADTDLVRVVEPVAVGGTGQAIVRISNGGRAELKLFARLSTGAAAFTVAPTEVVVSSNGTQELVVSFRPTVAGGREALLHLTAADATPLLTLPVTALGRATSSPLLVDLLELSTEADGKLALVGGRGCVNGDVQRYQLALVRNAQEGGERIPIAEDGGFRVVVDSQDVAALTLQLRDVEGVVLGSHPVRDLPSGLLQRERLKIESVRGGTATVRGEPGTVSTLTRYPQVLLRNTTRGRMAEVHVREDGSLLGQVAAAPGDTLALLALGGGRRLDAVDNLGMAPPFLRRDADRWTLQGEPGAPYSLYLPAGPVVRSGLAGKLDGKGRAELLRPAGVTQELWERMRPVVLVSPRDGRPTLAAIVQ